MNPPTELTDSQRAEILALLGDGNKIEAIKRYRTFVPQAGLAEAKSAIERMESDPASTTSAPDHRVQAIEGELVHLLQRGEMIPAIKRYREATGAGLKDARDAIDALARRHGIKVKSGPCFVATAVFEDENVPAVAALRAWRDQRLVRSTAGRCILRVYGLIGPGLAALVSRWPGCRRVLRPLIAGFARRVMIRRRP
jgi:ribosomal protein L7/L12